MQYIFFMSCTLHVLFMDFYELLLNLLNLLRYFFLDLSDENTLFLTQYVFPYLFLLLRIPIVPEISQISIIIFHFVTEQTNYIIYMIIFIFWFKNIHNWLYFYYTFSQICYKYPCWCFSWNVVFMLLLAIDNIWCTIQSIQE